MTTNLAVDLRDVWFSYGKVGVFEGLDLAIRDGEFFSIIGPTGCGKSTLLALIGLHLKPERGEVLFSRGLVKEGKARNVATVFQDDLLFPHLTMFENIAFGLRARGKTESEIACEVGRLADLLEIRDLYARAHDQVSGGQRQRVAIARTLAIKPKLLLLDEPLSSIDHRFRIQIRRLLRETQLQDKGTYVYVTHNQEEAFSLSDRVGILSRSGEIQQIGSPEEVYRKPCNSFVARFIGMENLFDVWGAQRRQDVIILTLRNSLNLFASNHTQRALSDLKRIGIHAQNLQLLRHSGPTPQPSMNLFEATVRRVEFHGALYTVHLSLRGGDSLLCETQTLEEGTVPGSLVDVYVPPTKVLLFFDDEP